MGKILRIPLKLNFTLNTLGCYGLDMSFNFDHEKRSHRGVSFKISATF